jgi:hypothetical protein
MTLILAYLFINHNKSRILSVADPLAWEEWDKDTPELTEEEAMRLLEQGEQDTPETARDQPQDDGDENDGEMDTTAAGPVGGGESASSGPRPTAAHRRRRPRGEQEGEKEKYLP